MNTAIKQNKYQLDKGFSKQTLPVEFVIFDLETTGFDFWRDQIIEIGAVKMNQAGEIVDRFQTFAALAKPVPQKIVELTHITDDMLAGQPDIKTAIKNFLEFAGEAILTAHNSDFDCKMLAAHMNRLNIGVYSYICLDTMTLAKNAEVPTENMKLGTLAEFYELNYDADAHHRADYDAELTAELLIKLLSLHKYTKATLNDLIIYSSGSAKYTPAKEPCVYHNPANVQLARETIAHLEDKYPHYGNVMLNQIHTSILPFVLPYQVRMNNKK